MKGALLLCLVYLAHFPACFCAPQFDLDQLPNVLVPYITQTEKLSEETMLGNPDLNPSVSKGVVLELETVELRPGVGGRPGEEIIIDLKEKNVDGTLQEQHMMKYLADHMDAQGERIEHLTQLLKTSAAEQSALRSDMEAVILAVEDLSEVVDEADEDRQRNTEEIDTLQKVVYELLKSAEALRGSAPAGQETDQMKIPVPRALPLLQNNYQTSDIFEGSRYYLFDGWLATNIRQAQDYCESVNGYLAEINNVREFNFVRKFVRQLVDPKKMIAVYIGGSDEAEEGVWRFPTTGQEMDYTRWDSPTYQPNEGRICNCVALLGGRYSWNMIDEPCNDWIRKDNWLRNGSQQFVCEAPQ